jgi:hypothetical protein
MSSITLLFNFKNLIQLYTIFERLSIGFLKILQKIQALIAAMLVLILTICHTLLINMASFYNVAIDIHLTYQIIWNLKNNFKALKKVKAFFITLTFYLYYF